MSAEYDAPHHNRSTDLIFQSTIVTSLGDELRARKKLLEIKIAQITQFLEITKKQLEIEESQSPIMPKVFNPLEPIPEFGNNTQVLLNCNNKFANSSLLLIPSSNEPIPPQFHPAKPQEIQGNSGHFNKGIAKVVRNVIKISKDDDFQDMTSKSKPAESRKSIHIKMELFERNEKLQSRYLQMNITQEVRDNFMIEKKKTLRSTTLNYESVPIERIVPLFWPSRPGDAEILLSHDANDNLYSKIQQLIASLSYESANSKKCSQLKKKKREKLSRMKFPMIDSSTASSEQQTDPDDFVL